MGARFLTETVVISIQVSANRLGKDFIRRDQENAGFMKHQMSNLQPTIYRNVVRLYY